MNINIFKRVSLLLGFATVFSFLGNAIARAETMGVQGAALDSQVEFTQASESDFAVADLAPEAFSVAGVPDLVAEPETSVVAEGVADPTLAEEFVANVELAPSEAVVDEVATTPDAALELDSQGEFVADVAPVHTSASALLAQPTFDVAQATTTEVDVDAEAIAPADAPQEIAQIQPVVPGRTTRTGPSYIGIGGNIGIGTGDTALGEGSFAVFSKIGLTNFISVRPSVLVSNNPTILLPVTIDFIPGVTGVTEGVAAQVTGLQVSPYAGVGAAISTGDNSAVDFLATAGVDVPLSPQVTATASISASLFDNTAVGILLGVGYNFGPLFE